MGVFLNNNLRKKLDKVEGVVIQMVNVWVVFFGISVFVIGFVFYVMVLVGCEFRV